MDLLAQEICQNMSLESTNDVEEEESEIPEDEMIVDNTESATANGKG